MLHNVMTNCPCFQYHGGIRQDRSGSEMNYIDLSGLILPGVVQQITGNILTEHAHRSVQATVSRVQSSDVYNVALKCSCASNDREETLVSSIICHNSQILIK